MENMHQATNPLIAAQVKWTISQTGLNLSIADWTHIGHVTNDVVAPGLPKPYLAEMRLDIEASAKVQVHYFTKEYVVLKTPAKKEQLSP